MIEINTNNTVINRNFNILESLDMISDIYKKYLNTKAYCVLLYGKEFTK